MAHFAKVVDGYVEVVLVADQSFIDNYIDPGRPGKWVQTSYNTIGGKHVMGGEPFRKNFAGVGYAYDEVRDAFIPPKPYNSWVLNEETCLWEPPVPIPMDREVVWDESIEAWRDAPTT